MRIFEFKNNKELRPTICCELSFTIFILFLSYVLSFYNLKYLNVHLFFKFPESKAAVEVLESMYSGTFTVEMSEVDTSFEEDSDPDDPDELSSVKKQLDMDKISQPLNEQSEHLKEMFGGKIPECLLKQVLSHLNGTATPKKAKRARKLPSLEKLEKVCRPPNSFMVFAQEYRPRLSEENPQCKNKDISIMYSFKLVYYSFYNIIQKI